MEYTMRAGKIRIYNTEFAVVKTVLTKEYSKYRRSLRSILSPYSSLSFILLRWADWSIFSSTLPWIFNPSSVRSLFTNSISVLFGTVSESSSAPLRQGLQRHQKHVMVPSAWNDIAYQRVHEIAFVRCHWISSASYRMRYPTPWVCSE